MIHCEYVHIYIFFSVCMFLYIYLIIYIYTILCIFRYLHITSYYIIFERRYPMIVEGSIRLFSTSNRHRPPTFFSTTPETLRPFWQKRWQRRMLMAALWTGVDRLHNDCIWLRFLWHEFNVRAHHMYTRNTYIKMYVHIFSYTYTHAHIYICIYIYICSICGHKNMNICIHTYIYIYIHMLIYIYIIYLHTHTHIYIYMYLYMYIYIQ